MIFELIQPPLFLKNHVQYFWTIKSTRESLIPVAVGPLADGFPGLIFEQNDTSLIKDDRNQQLSEMILYGQTVTRKALYLSGKFDIIGVSLYPDALKLIFRIDANELADHCAYKSDFLNADELFLNEQLAVSKDVSEKIEIISTFLFSRITRNNISRNPAIQYSLTQIMKANGNISLPKLQKELKISERSLERKFMEHVGISPKLYSRICRFQSALRQLKSNSYSKLTDIAYDNGYADQSHFIRAFKEFAGFSPYRFNQNSNPIADNFPLLVK
jgi:AraC-like DNA-binding protein